MKHEFRPHFDTSGEVGDCNEAEALLTALFDGEASADQAARARAHLLLCRRCATMWAQWNTTRRLLQTSLPVTAPPPTLLARILLACRLGVRPAAPPATANLGDLQARILAQTTGAPLPRGRNWAPLSAFAVPAVAAWLLLLQHPWAPSTLQPVASIAVPSVPTRSVKTATSSAKTSNLVEVSAALSPDEWETALVLAVQTPAQTPTVRVEAPARVALVNWAASERPTSAPTREIAAQPREIHAAVRETAPVAPAVLASDVAPVRLRPAARPLLASRRLSAATSTLRASLPTLNPAPAARLANLEIPAREDDEAEDRHLEEVRSLVDDYRATLVSDNFEEDATFNG